MDMNKIKCAGRIALLIGDRWNEHRVTTALQSAGVCVESPKNTLGLLSLLARQPVDLVLVEDKRNDLVDCIASLRFHGQSGIPVVAIGPASMQHIIDGLSQGACDYVSVSDSDELLTHRILARLVLSRRPTERTVLTLGDLVLDADCRTLRCAGIDFSLTSREFELAWTLFESAGEVVNLQTLSRRVWGREASLAKRTIEQHISRVRQKLARAGATVGALVQLQAIHNIGYRLTQSPLMMTVRAQDSANDFPVAA